MVKFEKLPLIENKLNDIENERHDDKLFQIKEDKTFMINCSPNYVRGIVLSFHKITAQLKPKRTFFPRSTQIKTPRCILRDVSGKVEPGELLAIMGSSGAGKTTLLNVLTNRNLRSLDVKGDVKLNGHIVGDSLAQYCAYVQQDDLLCSFLTVREHLIFQALLRMDENLSYQERMQTVEDTLVELSLTNCADTRIGIPGSVVGISGGERKRLTFAIEVLTNPLILCCDEPTSGLDSYISLNVVAELKKLCQGGRTIIFTVHQPSSDVFEIFDNILLMAEGRVAYMGSKEGAITFFESLNMMLPMNFNPADFFIYNLAIIPEKRQACIMKIDAICNVFDKCKSYYSSTTETKAIINCEGMDLPEVPRYKSSWLTQFNTLIWRGFLELRFEGTLNFIGLFMAIFITTIEGILFYNQQLNQKGIRNIQSCVFLLLIQVTYRTWLPAVTRFCTKMPIFHREHGNGMYRTDTYFLSMTIVDLPIAFAISIICPAIIYHAVGFNPEIWAFGICVLTMVLATHAAVSYGYMISCFCGSTAWTIIIAPSFLIPILGFGGYFLNNGSVPKFAIWMRNLSYLFYANEILMINQWKDVRNITCEFEASSCIYDGKGILKHQHFDESQFRPNFVKLVGLIVFYRVLAFIAFYMRSRRKS